MARVAALAAVVVGLLVLTGAPALAQRDPFEPLVSQQGTSSGGVPAQDGGAPQPQPQPAGGVPEGLPATGADVLDPLAAAYVLVALGAGALAYRRLAR